MGLELVLVGSTAAICAAIGYALYHVRHSISYCEEEEEGPRISLRPLRSEYADEDECEEEEEVEKESRYHGGPESDKSESGLFTFPITTWKGDHFKIDFEKVKPIQYTGFKRVEQEQKPIQFYNLDALIINDINRQSTPDFKLESKPKQEFFTSHYDSNLDPFLINVAQSEPPYTSLKLKTKPQASPVLTEQITYPIAPQGNLLWPSMISQKPTEQLFHYETPLERSKRERREREEAYRKAREELEYEAEEAQRGATILLLDNEGRQVGHISKSSKLYLENISNRPHIEEIINVSGKEIYIIKSQQTFINMHDSVAYHSAQNK